MRSTFTPAAPVAPVPRVNASSDAALLASNVGDAAWESRVQSSYGYSVPRRFLWLIDVLVQTVAVLVAHGVTPKIQALAGGGVQRLEWLSWLSLPDPRTMADYRPLAELLWIPIVMVPSTLLFMQLLGGYRPLLSQSRTRLAISSFGAPFLSLSVVAV